MQRSSLRNPRKSIPSYDTVAPVETIQPVDSAANLSSES